MKIVVDAYAWVEIFAGSEKGRRVAELIRKAEEVYTPDTVLAEIARKYLKEGVGESEVMKRLAAIEELSEVVAVDGRVALEAAKCYMELLEKSKTDRLAPPSLFDSVVLAVARLMKAKVVTGDKHLEGFETILLGDDNL